MPPDNSVQPYSAFISYEDSDNREEGRRWADWIRDLLESYEVPQEFAGRTNNRGERMPSALRPVIQNGPALHDGEALALPVREALDVSAILIVVCSPRAVASRAVWAAICNFKQSGKSDRVLALIVEGEPNADDPGKLAAGLDPAAECFPEALRFGTLNAEGVLDWSLLVEPLAADVRPGHRAEQGWTDVGHYRIALRKAGRSGSFLLRRLEREYGEQLRLARLKLLAGVLGVNLGRLTRRDEAMRRQRFRRWALTLGLLACLMLAAVAVALWQRRVAVKRGAEVEVAVIKNHEAQAESSLHDYGSAESSFAKGEWRRGLAYLAHTLKLGPHNADAAFTLWEQVVYGRGDRDSLPLLSLPHTGAVSSASFSPDGAAVLVAGADKSARIFDSRTGRQTLQLVHPAEVISAVFNHDGSQVLTAAKDRSIRLWDARSGVQLGKPHQCDTDPTVASLSRDGTRIVVATPEGSLLLDRATMKPIPVPQIPGAMTASGACGTAPVFSPNGDVLVAVERFSGKDIPSFQYHPGAGGRLTAEKTVLHREAVWALVFRHSESGAPLQFWGISNRLEYKTGFDPATGPAFGAEKPYFTGDNTKVFTSATLLMIDGRDVGCHSLLVHRSQDGADAGPIVRSEIKDRRLLLPPLHHDSKVNSAAFSPDADEILIGCSDGTAVLWNSAKNFHSAPRRFPHPASVTGAGFSPDGERIFTVCDDRIVRIWSVATVTVIASFDNLVKVRTAAFSPDGLRLLTLADDSSVRLWDASAHSSGDPWQGEPSSIGAMQNSSGSQSLSLEGNTVLLTDRRTGQPVGAALTHLRNVRNAGFSSDGSFILTLDDQGSGHRWETPQLPPPNPDQITQAAAVLGGWRFTDHDALEKVPLDERVKLAAQWRNTASESSPWDALVHWSINRDPQHCTPLSKSSRRQVADTLISTGRTEEIDEARMLDPANPKLPPPSRDALRHNGQPKGRIAPPQ